MQGERFGSAMGAKGEHKRSVMRTVEERFEVQGERYESVFGAQGERLFSNARRGVLSDRKESAKGV